MAAGIALIGAPDPASRRMAVDHRQVRYYPNGQFCQEPGPNFFAAMALASDGAARYVHLTSEAWQIVAGRMGVPVGWLMPLTAPV
jgi:hypothetical protein